MRFPNNLRNSDLRRLVLMHALLFLCATSVANGIDADRKISQYGHTAWRVQDGAIAPGSTIAQTIDGYLWLGTSAGLMRFDGVRFVRWQPPHGQDLPGTHFTALFGSRDGSLWIGTTRGLSRLKDGQLRTYTDLTHPTGIFAIIEDNSGTIWATRYGPNAREAPLCSISEDTLRCFGKKDGIPVGYGLGLAHDNAGNIWFGGERLCRWRPGTSATAFFADIADKLAKGGGVADVAIGPAGTVWASLDGTGPQLGVRYYSAGKWRSYVVPGFDGEKVLSHALLFDREGSLWVGTENDGLYRIHDGVADHYAVSDGLSGNGADLFFEDREGDIWIRTDGGLDMFRDMAIISYTTHQGLSDSSVRSVLALRNGSVWIATDGGLNILRKEDRLTVISGRELLHHNVYSMIQDHTGAVWLGVDNTFMRYQNGLFREIRGRGGQPLAHDGAVTGIAEDAGRKVWVLTSQNQLFSVIGNTINPASLSNALSRQRYLAADPNGGIWLSASEGAVSYYRDGRLQTTSLNSPEGPVEVHALLVDVDNSLLVSTSQGLYRVRDGQVSVFNSDNGLPCPTVISAIRDNHQALWIYTQCGLVRIKETEWAKWLERPHAQISITVLDALDGAQAGTGDPLQPRSSRAPDGRLWFVTGVSAQVVNPDRLYKNAAPPPVYVEAVVADRKVLQTGFSMQVPALTRDLQINYTALSFSIPQKVRFRYILEGHDREWQDAGTRRQAFYTNLAPRKYRFRVIACNNSGVWNETGTFLDFSIAPAYYQTNWFRALCVAAFLAFLWTLHQFRVWELRQREKKLREVIATIPTFAWTALPDGSADFVNRHWQEYTGLSAEKTAGSGWQAAVYPEDLERHAARWRASLASGEPFESEVRYRRAADGQYRWFLARAVPLRNGRGDIVRWYGTSTDIEDRKRAEELQADLAHINRVATMGELTASLAHEIKQPIGAAVTNAEVCLRLLSRHQPDIPDAREAAQEMAKDARRAADIIERLRSLSRKGSPQLEMVDVNEVIAEMVAMLRNEANRYSVVMRTDLAEGLPNVMADRVQLQQVLMNLMLNGIEAMRENGAELSIKSQLNVDGQLLICVTDDGCGLPIEDVDRIFNAFFTTKSQGTGLGLAITRSILELHGGRVWAAANSGRGTTFHFTLPIKTAVSA